MGYSTSYEGKFGFRNELTFTQLAVLKTVIAEETDEELVNEANAYVKGLGGDTVRCLCLELSKDQKHIEWDGCEKFNDIENSLNFLTFIMRKHFEDFSLTGSCLAQGESVGDIWRCYINDLGVAIREDISLESFAKKTIQCPHCGESFEHG
jgi:hypothetical protein